MILQWFTLLLATLPGLLICWYIYRMDKYERESRLQLLLHFALGAFITWPVYELQLWCDSQGIGSGSQIGHILVVSFLVVALLEELFKYVVLMGYTYGRTFFNEPLDGIVYAVMTGMGFATVENILYAQQQGWTTTLLRAFTAVPAHAAFGIMMGYFVGRAKFSELGSYQLRLLLTGLVLPVGMHGLYNFFLLQKAYDELMLLALVVLVVSLFFARRLVLEQQERSPFRED